jgi:hypothetical protein
MSKFNQGNTKASKLTGVEVMQIREKYASGIYTQSRLSREFRVSISTIRNIVTGVSWQDLPDVTPQHVADESAMRSLRKLDAMLGGEVGMNLPTPVTLTDEELRRLDEALTTQAPQMPLDANIAARAAAYGVRAVESPHGLCPSAPASGASLTESGRVSSSEQHEADKSKE